MISLILSHYKPKTQFSFFDFLLIHLHISVPLEHNRYYYEVCEFIDLTVARKTESEVNTLDNSLATIEIIDEIRRQLGVVYPADKCD